MKTEVSILHHDYPNAVRETVVEKLQHLDRFYDRTQSVRAVLEKQHDVHRVELLAQVRGQVLVVDSRSETFSKALDGSVERMARTLSKHKDKIHDTRRRPRL